MLAAQCLQFFSGFFNFFVGWCRIDHRCVQYGTGGIHNCQLTAGTVCRVKAQCDLIFYWRLHEQGTQIEGKGGNCLFVGGIRQFLAQLTSKGWKQQALPGI